VAEVRNLDRTTYVGLPSAAQPARGAPVTAVDAAGGPIEGVSLNPVSRQREATAPSSVHLGEMEVSVILALVGL
jgi:hypothetical protein